MCFLCAACVSSPSTLFAIPNMHTYKDSKDNDILDARSKGQREERERERRRVELTKKNSVFAEGTVCNFRTMCAHVCYSASLARMYYNIHYVFNFFFRSLRSFVFSSNKNKQHLFSSCIFMHYLDVCSSPFVRRLHIRF